MFVYVGGESDEWVEDALSQAKNDIMKVINLMDVMGDKAKVEELKEGMQEGEHEHEHDHEEGEEEHEEDDIVNLVIDQIEFCDLIVLNKTDLLSLTQLEEVKKVLRDYQTKAPMIPSVNGSVDPKLIMHGEEFNYDMLT